MPYTRYNSKVFPTYDCEIVTLQEDHSDSYQMLALGNM